MNNLYINIRLLFWHFQVDFNRKVSFTVNGYRLQHKKKSILIPISIFSFDIIGLIQDKHNEEKNKIRRKALAQYNKRFEKNIKDALRNFELRNCGMCKAVINKIEYYAPYCKIDIHDDDEYLYSIVINQSAVEVCGLVVDFKFNSETPEKEFYFKTEIGTRQIDMYLLIELFAIMNRFKTM